MRSLRSSRRVVDRLGRRRARGRTRACRRSTPPRSRARRAARRARPRRCRRRRPRRARAASRRLRAPRDRRARDTSSRRSAASPRRPRSSTASGSFTTASSGTHDLLGERAVEHRRRDAIADARRAVTPAPTARTTPAASPPGENGGVGLNWYLPCDSSTSGKLTPAARTSIRTSPGPGVGLGDLVDAKARGTGELVDSGRRAWSRDTTINRPSW